MSSALSAATVEPDRPTRARVVVAAGLVATSAVATSTELAFFPRLGLWARLGVFVVACVPLAALLVSRHMADALDRRFVLGLAVATLVVSSTVSPRLSGDIGQYAFYGREVAHEHVSPYAHTAAEFPHDPVARRVAPRWQHTPSPYGPGFAVVSAAGMGLVGTSARGARVLFQGLALGAALVALFVLLRSGAPAVAIAAFGLHPVTAITVNGGNNDLLVGLAALGAVLLAVRGRPTAAGVVGAAGALVKIGGLLPLVGVALWTAWRYGPRAVTRLALTAGGIVAGAYLVAGGGTAVQPLRDAARQWSRAAVWNAPRDWLQSLFTFHGPTAGGVSRDAAALTGRTATVTVLVVTVLVLIAARRRLGAAPAAVVGPLVYLLGAAYVLPRYASWATPPAALAWRSWPSRILFLAAAVLQFVYLRPANVVTGPATGFLTRLDVTVVPILAAVTILVVLGLAVLRRDPTAGAVRVPRP